MFCKKQLLENYQQINKLNLVFPNQFININYNCFTQYFFRSKEWLGYCQNRNHMNKISQNRWLTILKWRWNRSDNSWDGKETGQIIQSYNINFQLFFSFLYVTYFVYVPWCAGKSAAGILLFLPLLIVLKKKKAKMVWSYLSQFSMNKQVTFFT